MSSVSAQLYETDFYGWIQSQANALKAGNFARLDLDNLIGEIEDMGKSQHRELESRLDILLMHLLKWRFQPEMKTSSWSTTIEVQRNELGKLIRDNPSLKSRLPAAFESSYKFAIRLAATETGMDKSTFPGRCPWTFEQVMDPDYWPEPA